MGHPLTSRILQNYFYQCSKRQTLEGDFFQIVCVSQKVRTLKQFSFKNKIEFTFMLNKTIFGLGTHCAAVKKGAVHKRRRQLGKGKGVKNWSILPTDGTKKLPK